ncbi:MAG: hypothetical protein ACOX52_16610 [Verrucomicrobiota bacterium]
MPIRTGIDPDSDTDPDPDSPSADLSRGRPKRSSDPDGEIAEGAEVYWEGVKGTYIGAVFNNCLGQLNRYH